MPKEKIKLVIAINDFLVGGAQRLIVELLKRLDRDKFDMTLLTLMEFDGRDTMYELIPKDIRVQKLHFNKLADIQGFISLAKFLREEKPDVVFSHLFFTNTVIRILNLFMSYKTITVEHNTYVGNKRWQIWCDRLLAPLSKKIVAVSKQVMEFAKKQQWLSGRKLVVIANGIDTEVLGKKATESDRFETRQKLGLSSDAKIIISVGRLTGQKEPLLLIDGFARFAKSHPAYHLTVLGDGALRQDMEKFAEELGIKTQVHFLGNVTDIHRYYAIAEFLISTSSIEGLSMAHLEALACGVPILATRTAGSEELIKEGWNGLFISEWTPDAVEKGLVRMAEENMSPMRDEARATARNYDISKTAEKYEKLIWESFNGIKHVR